MQRPQKKLILKLGTRCNLGCSHCHQAQKNFVEHPHLVEWIKAQNFDRITFSGGEPLMYFPTVSRIMDAVGKKPLYRMMTNGTLLTKEICEKLNEFPNIMLGVSYDGQSSRRDDALPIRWDSLHHLKHHFGISTCWSNPKRSFREVLSDITETLKTHNLPVMWGGDFYKINFLHQTTDAPNVFATTKVADRFCEESALQLEKLFYLLSLGFRGLEGTTANLVGRWHQPKIFEKGCACCNENTFNVNLDGSISLCPYGMKKIGSIDEGIDWNAVEEAVPKRCRGCEYWSICGCSCVANVTDHECRINRKMIPIVRELAEKYSVVGKLDAVYNCQR